MMEQCTAGEQPARWLSYLLPTYVTNFCNYKLNCSIECCCHVCHAQFYFIVRLLEERYHSDLIIRSQKLDHPPKVRLDHPPKVRLHHPPQVRLHHPPTVRIISKNWLCSQLPQFNIPAMLCQFRFFAFFFGFFPHPSI